MTMMASQMVLQLQALIEQFGDQPIVSSQDRYMSFQYLPAYPAPAACCYFEQDQSVIEQSEFDEMLKNEDTDEPYSVNCICIN
jgi:hypothetical protein